MVVRQPLCHRSARPGEPSFSPHALSRVRAAAGGRDRSAAPRATGPRSGMVPVGRPRAISPALLQRPSRATQRAARDRGRSSGSAPFLTRPNCVGHGAWGGRSACPRCNRIAQTPGTPHERPSEYTRTGARRRCGQRRPDPHRHGDRRRRPGRAVRGVRGRPAQHQVPPGRQSRPAGRPMRRALPGQADLRHPGGAALHRPGADRPAAAADPTVRARVPPEPAGRGPGAPGRRPLAADDQQRAGPGSAGDRDRRRRRQLRAAPAAAARRGRARGALDPLCGAPDGGFPGQGPPDRGRRRLGARLDAQPAPARQPSRAGPPARRVPRGARTR